tara:strand:- start:793 stop:1077 length:285 start_codon:yes stop_codon:yes gene_type:complete
MAPVLSKPSPIYHGALYLAKDLSQIHYHFVSQTDGKINIEIPSEYSVEDNALIQEIFIKIFEGCTHNPHWTEFEKVAIILDYSVQIFHRMNEFM